MFGYRTTKNAEQFTEEINTNLFRHCIPSKLLISDYIRETATKMKTISHYQPVLPDKACYLYLT